MPARQPRRALAAVMALALAVAGAAPVSALEHTRFEPLWIAPAMSRPQEAGGGYTIPALLNLPPGWSVGDGAVILLSDGPWAEPSRLGLTAALLDEGAAVLELDVNTARGFSPDSGTTGTAPAGRDLLPDVFAALLALRRDQGVGIVVALGFGAGGEAALRAATEGEATRHMGDIGPRLAAAAALGPGPTRFAAGAAPGVAEGWPRRAHRLCHVLAGPSVPGLPDPMESCLTAFLDLAPDRLAAWAQ